MTAERAAALANMIVPKHPPAPIEKVPERPEQLPEHLPDDIVIAVALQLETGGELIRRYTFAEVSGDPNPAEFLHDGPPPWWERPSKVWHSPDQPLIFRGIVKAGHENDARQLLGLDDDA
jgi:hypothetical protein